MVVVVVMMFGKAVLLHGEEGEREGRRRVRSRLALAGVGIVKVAGLRGRVCAAEAEKPRLTNRGRLRQPCLCFYAWPHST